MSSCLKSIVPVALVGVVLGIGAQAHAALIVYEGFQDYTLGNPLIGQTPGANTIGIKTTSDKKYFNNTADTGAGAEYITDGLNFSYTSGLTMTTLTTAGGAEYVEVNVASKRLKPTAWLNVTATGTLYSSALVEMSSFSSDTGGTTALVAGDGASLGFQPAGGSATNRAAAFYDSATSAASGSALETDTTYLALTKFTHVGENVSVADPGVATLWMLTPSQFAGFVESGLNETYLNTAGNVYITATDTSTANKKSFVSGNYIVAISMYAASTTGSAESCTFDEVRWGNSSFADVVPYSVVTVPEPSSLALLMAGLVGLLAYAWRKRK